MRVWFNPRCSKCRRARDLLDARPVEYDLYEYLRAAPTRRDIEHVLQLLGTDDPRAITRVEEADYSALGLADAGREELLAALVEHPQLIERPIVIRGERAVVARPPERLQELF